MNLNSTELELIRSYLEAVGDRLNEPDRDETLAEIESHIHEAIATRFQAEEGPGLVEAVLAEMEPPEHYGSPPVPTGQGGLCGFALAGALLLPWGLPVLYHVILLTPAGDGGRMPAFYDNSLYHFLVLPVGLISMILSVVFGWCSVGRIRKSSGALSGFPLAAIDTIFYPLLLVNLVAFIVMVNVLDAAEGGVGRIFVLPLMLLPLLGNISVFRRAYQSLKHGRSILRPIVVHIGVYVLIMIGLIAWGTSMNRGRGERAMQEYEASVAGMEREFEMASALPAEFTSDDLNRPWTGLMKFMRDAETSSRSKAERLDALKTFVDPEVVESLMAGVKASGSSRIKAKNGEYLESTDLQAYLKGARTGGSTMGGLTDGVAGDSKAMNSIRVTSELYTFEVPVRYVTDLGWRLGKSDLIHAIILSAVEE